MDLDKVFLTIVGWLPLINTAILIGVGYLFNQKLERLKFKISKETSRYSTIHNKRVEVLAEVYARIKRGHRHMGRAVSPIQLTGDFKKLAKTAGDAAQDFSDYADEHALFLPRKLAEKIRDLDGKMRDIWFRFGRSHPNLQGGGAVDAKEWNAAWTELTDKVVPKILVELEDEMRRLIDIDEDARKG